MASFFGSLRLVLISISFRQLSLYRCWCRVIINNICSRPIMEGTQNKLTVCSSAKTTVGRERAYCFVTTCKNNHATTPDKAFFYVPFDNPRRQQWIEAAGNDVHKIGSRTIAHVCEDHFDLPNDMENYRRWTIMKGNKKLKRNVVPHLLLPTKKTEPIEVENRIISFASIAYFFKTHIHNLKRGESIYERGNVVNVSFDPETDPISLKGDVKSNTNLVIYSVEIHLVKNECIVRAMCTCPQQLICDHIAAVCIFGYHHITVSRLQSDVDLHVKKKSFRPYYCGVKRGVTDKEIAAFKQNLGTGVGFARLL